MPDSMKSDQRGVVHIFVFGVRSLSIAFAIQYFVMPVNTVHDQRDVVHLCLFLVIAKFESHQLPGYRWFRSA